MQHCQAIPRTLSQVSASCFRVNLVSFFIFNQMSQHRCFVTVVAVRQVLPSVLAVLLRSGCVDLDDLFHKIQRKQIPPQLVILAVILDC